MRIISVLTKEKSYMPKSVCVHSAHDAYKQSISQQKSHLFVLFVP